MTRIMNSSRELEPSDIFTDVERAQLTIVQRRELALRTTGAISSILDTTVTVPLLLAVTDGLRGAVDKREQKMYLNAVRALRCVASVAKPESRIVETFGSGSVYHYAEGVVVYGASESKYLELHKMYQLPASGITALYALRNQVAEQCDERLPSFKSLAYGIESLGMSVSDAVLDTDAVTEAFDEAGFFVQYLESRTFDRPIFGPEYVVRGTRLVPDDVDGSLSAHIMDGFLQELSRPPEEYEY